MEWARTSCWTRRAGGLTSREEYSMTGSLTLVLESVRVSAAGNCVRSIDWETLDSDLP
jgi:hypothetical protein